MSDEVAKLQAHLDLLREEYVKLQTKFAEVESKYQVAVATSGRNNDNSFVAKLLKTVAELFEKELYSDLTIKLQDHEIEGHRFVLAARSDSWGVPDLGNVTALDLTELPYEVSHSLLKWVYTNEVNLKQDDGFLLNLLKGARQFKLDPLSDRCEQALMSLVHVRNCIRFYQTAEEIGAETLKQHCSELISNHWNDFTAEDFVTLPAPLAYKMFKSKSQYPLHTAIRTHREDVVFLYLVEHDSLLPGKLNEVDSRGDLALDLALQDRMEGIAQTLVKHKVDVNRMDHSGLCLLHKAIKRGDEYASKFLIKNGCNVNACTPLDKETPLHLVAGYDPEATSTDVLKGMANTAKLLLTNGADPNAQDNTGSTPLHTAVSRSNISVFTYLLEEDSLNLEIQDADNQTALWLALQKVPSSDQYTEDSLAGRLIKRGCSPNAVNKETGDSLLHLATRAKMELAGLFLANSGANGNISNNKGESPLHTSCQQGLADLTLTLLEKGANPNAQTLSALSNNIDTDTSVFKQTPLHLAINNRNSDVVKVFLEHKASVTQSGDNLKIIPNFSLRDSDGQTAFALALWQGFHDIALQLLASGANVNDCNSSGLTLLHQAIEKHDVDSALFLLAQGADPNARTYENKSCLQLAIRNQLAAVVDVLCQKGASMDVLDENNSCPLWDALESGQEEVASILVRHGCDPNMWGPGPEDCQHTLLHRAIDENNESAACFLIRSMCDVNSPRRPGPHGEGGDEARDGQGPSHLAASWGQEPILQVLLEHNADINAQDVEGKTPLHIAIENQHHAIISLLLSFPGLNLMARDKRGLTPFAAAMTTKNNKAAQSVLDREPTAAEQFDNRGRNFLHLAIQKADIESVLFLISVHVNVNSRIQDSSQLTPLHIAVLTGSEMIVRNLLLAGANINDLTPQKQTCLHLAAAHDHSSICTILLENSIYFDALDDGLNNALHLAVQHGHLASVRVLLTESQISAESINMRGQNPIHVLGQYGRENAAAIFDLFMECMPNYPIDAPDVNGDTILLLAYFNGNVNLCKAVVRAGTRLGIINRNGLSIFNAPVATKQLLFKLLDMLSKEPPWCEGESCLECAAKFNIKTRKHHCRHCGRILCSKCSGRDMPILKYNIQKPVRVCEICFDVLTLGGIANS